MTEFLVECPKCKKDAIVSDRFSQDTNRNVLVCNNCNYIKRANEFVRFNAIVKRGCDNCGKIFEINIPNNKEKVEELTVPCPQCGIVRTFKPKNEEYKLFYKTANVSDPVVNLPLWLQSQIKGNAFWAYNREHLVEIRSYVLSKLRERQILTHTTMVERLPNFIKEAENRSILLKEIEKLLNK